MAIPSSKDIKYWLFLAVFIIVIIMFLRLLVPFIAPLILSAIIVSIFTPVYYFFNRWLPQSVASFICCGLICVIIFIPFVIIITILANQALTLYSSVMNSEFMMNLTAEVDGNWIVSQVNYALEKLNIGYTISGDQVYQFIGRLGSRFGSFLYAQATNITSNFIRLIINFCFMILISYYLFGNGRRVISFFVGLSPLPEGHEVAVLQRLKTTAGAIFVGSFISGVIQGTIGGITLWYFGFPAPFLWAVVMVILAFLPIVGIGLVFVPCIVITFVGGDYLSGIIMAVIYVASSSITEYIIIPRLEGKRSQMHTVFIFLSVLGGLQMFGIIGVLYGPLIITAFLALYEIYRANYVEQPVFSITNSGVVVATDNKTQDLFEEPPQDDKHGKANAWPTAAFAGKAAGVAEMAAVADTLKQAMIHKHIVTDDDNDIAMGDDIEPEFHESSGEPFGTELDVSGIMACNDDDADTAVESMENEPVADETMEDAFIPNAYGAVKAALDDYPGSSFVDYPGGEPPLITDDTDNDSPDGLIWNSDRPAHLPFPKAENADKLADVDSDNNPDVSIKDIVRADITSFSGRGAGCANNKDDSLDDKTTEE